MATHDPLMKSVILDGSSDWHEWLFLVMKKAIDADSEKLIGSDLDEESHLADYKNHHPTRLTLTSWLFRN